MKENFDSNYNRNFDDESFIRETGGILLIGIGLVLVTIAVLLLGKCCKVCNAKCIKLVEKIKATLIWNAFIRTSLQGYLQIAFAGLPILLTFSSSNQSQRIYSIVCIMILIALPTIYGILLY